MNNPQTEQSKLVLCEKCKYIGINNNMIKCIHQDCDNYVHSKCPTNDENNSNFSECKSCSIEKGIDFVVQLAIYFVLILMGIYINAKNLEESMKISYDTIRITSIISILFLLLFMTTYRKFIPCDDLASK